MIPEGSASGGKGVALIGCDVNKDCTKGKKCNVLSLGILLNRPSNSGGCLGWLVIVLTIRAVVELKLAHVTSFPRFKVPDPIKALILLGGSHLPTNFELRQPKDHVFRSPSCIWTSRQTLGWGLQPDLTWPAPTKLEAFFDCFRNCSQKYTVWVERILFLGPRDPRGLGTQPQTYQFTFLGECGPHCQIWALGSIDVAAYSVQAHMQPFTITMKQSLKAWVFRTMMKILH